MKPIYNLYTLIKYKSFFCRYNTMDDKDFFILLEMDFHRML